MLPAIHTPPEIAASSARSPEVICHCLGIPRETVAETIERGAAQTVKCVIRETGAGSGCTACHCTIRNMLEAAGYQVRCHSRGRSNALALSDELAPIAG